MVRYKENSRLFSRLFYKWFFAYLSFRPCFRNSSSLRRNLYSGGPNRKPISTNSNKNSSHPIAITGRQASVASRSASKPLSRFLLIGYSSLWSTAAWSNAVQLHCEHDLIHRLLQH